jgi:glycosyltransferase involved in cell wall biosynthesis
MACIPSRILYRLIVRKRYDVVISYLEGPTTHILEGCPYEDSQKVAWVHVEMKNRKQLSVGFRSIKEALMAYHKFNKVVFVAKTVQESFMKISGESLANACVLYNTVDSDTILKKAHIQSEPELFLDDEFNIISVGRVIRAKGFDRLAVVQKRLLEAGYKTHVYILGTGAEQEDLEKYAIENGISDSFTFLGFHENPYPIVFGADLFVCSSRREGLSTAVTEALILGVPVVSTECSGACELLGENDEYGIVTENSAKALYEGIRKILDIQGGLEHYRKAAITRGRDFETEKTVEAVEEILLNL